MTTPKLAALAIAAAFAIPAYAQMSIPGVTKTKEVEKLSKSDISKEMLLKNGDIDACKNEAKKKEPKVSGNFAARSRCIEPYAYPRHWPSSSATSHAHLAMAFWMRAVNSSSVGGSVSNEMVVDSTMGA